MFLPYLVLKAGEYQNSPLQEKRAFMLRIIIFKVLSLLQRQRWNNMLTFVPFGKGYFKKQRNSKPELKYLTLINVTLLDARKLFLSSFGLNKTR